MQESLTQNDELLVRQLKLEEEMVTCGVEDFYRQIQKAEEKGHTANTLAGMQMRKRLLDPMMKALDQFKKSAAQGKPGRNSIAYTILKDVPSDKAAFITLTVVINGFAKDSSTLQSVSINIGKAIEDEMRLTKFSKENNPYFKAVFERVKGRNDYRYKKNVLIHAMNNGAKIAWDDWSSNDKLHVGRTLVELLVESTGIIELGQKSSGKGNPVWYVTVPRETFDWLVKCNSRCESFAPKNLPMLIPPKPWRSPFEGGYLSDMFVNKNLVKRVSGQYLQELANSDISDVYTAVNAIQDTPWRVNSKVLEVMDHLWELNSQRGKLPNREDYELPARVVPRDVDVKTLPKEMQEAHQKWRREAADIKERNNGLTSKRAHVSMIIKLAKRFKQDVIYFPYSIDWRGRVYPLANYLTPQGDDFARSLLVFAEGKPIDNDTAKNWLAIHGANCYGNDKVSFEERVQFIVEKTPDILRIAEDPLTHREWEDADKPWQYLAFCFEWAGLVKSGSGGYVSSLPVQLDGTCNGLQHFSAMLRDRDGGEAVNLVPADKPQDIYQRVADKVREKLNNIIRQGGEKAYHAMEWLLLKDGVTRKLTKKPVMVLPYGGTRVGNRKAVEEFIKKYMKDNELDSCPFKCDVFEASVFMGDLVWESIEDVVVSARYAMDWLKKVAQIVSSEDIPISWTSPSGLPIMQRKTEVRSRRVITKLMGATVKLRLNEETDKIDKVAQQNGISPNFIHSLDAAALHLYVGKMVDQEVRHFSLIHDSYGTLAADTELSTRLLRESFIEIYRTDVLAKFRDEVVKMLPPDKAKKIPPLPAKGTLDIEQIAESQFFFA